MPQRGSEEEVPPAGAGSGTQERHKIWSEMSGMADKLADLPAVESNPAEHFYGDMSYN